MNVYCQGTKKNGQPCRRYLGKVEGKAELLNIKRGDTID